MRVQAGIRELLLGTALFAAANGLCAATPEAKVEQALAREAGDPNAARIALAQLLPGLPTGAARNRAVGKLCILTAVADAKAGLPMAIRALVDARARGDKKLQAELLRCEGYARESMGQTTPAMRRYTEAVVAAELAGDRETLAEALASRGELRHFTGDYGNAIIDLKRSYDLFLALGLPIGTRYSLNAMANLYADANVGEYDKAIAYYRELLSSHQKSGRSGAVATAHFNLGSTLERKGELAAALPHYQRAYEIDKSLGDLDSVADERRAIGALLAKQGKALQALPWIDQALAHFEQRKDPDGVARTRLTRGIALRTAGKPGQGLVDLDASRGYFLAEGNQRFLVRIAEERALALSALEQWQPAYEALGEQLKSQSEIDRKLAAERTARLRVQFGAERTERLNDSLQLENQRRGDALHAAERERRLQAQVIALGIVLLLVLSLLALRQLVKGRRLRALALTDELTDLPNRRNILAFLDQQVRLARRSGQPLSVLSFDIDHFKEINDKHGHGGGDCALRQMAATANKELRITDRLGRVGGEEFLVVLPNTSLTTAAEIAERTRRLVEATVFEEGAPGLRMSISAGASEWAGNKELVDALIKRADEALYRAKESGRNRVELG